MKCLIILACLACVAYADIICLIGGNYACKINCIASGVLHGGSCHKETNDCTCITEEGGDEKPKPKAELLCILGGDLACEINCLTSKGHFEGHCNENKDCLCKARPTAPEARSDLACTYGENTCHVFCKYTGHSKGTCNDEKECICEK